MNAASVQRWMESNSIKSISRIPVTGEYRIVLRCEGYSGYGETVADALRQARELNADFLEWAA